MSFTQLATEQLGLVKAAVEAQSNEHRRLIDIIRGLRESNRQLKGQNGFLRDRLQAIISDPEIDTRHHFLWWKAYSFLGLMPPPKKEPKAMTEHEHSEDVEDLTAHITALNTRTQILTDGLVTAMRLIDQLLTELRMADVTPSAGLIVSKATFDAAMHMRLKDERSQPDR